jgi:hypothetical protein
MLAIEHPALWIRNPISFGSFSNKFFVRHSVHMRRLSGVQLQSAFEHFTCEIEGAFETLNHRVPQFLIAGSR